MPMSLALPSFVMWCLLQARPAVTAESASEQDDDADDDDGSESAEDDFEARHRRVMAETAARPAVLRPSTQVSVAG